MTGQWVLSLTPKSIYIKVLSHWFARHVLCINSDLKVPTVARRYGK